ncbi:MAG: 2-dehydropantoate 2-reductase [Chloroflexota bacterium]|nr:2-dehydropantoate 2-reductase [Chloroflexota bacterium]
MCSTETIYVLGCAAIGFPLAAYLAHAGRRVVAVRTSRQDVPQGTVTVTVHNGANRLSTPVETISLSKLTRLAGTIAITTKSYANQAIARELKDKAATAPIVILQNGVGVEKPFLDAQFSSLYRCVLYVTNQATSASDFICRPVTASPIGLVNGTPAGLERCVEALTTDGFPFRSEANIEREVWKKAIINCVFNSLCPLLDVDNGVFVRDEATAKLAREVVRECIMLTDRLKMGLSESELMEQIMRISQGSDGQLISTLQDIRMGRQTEIEFLNLEIARVAASLQPSVPLPRVEFLGKMIVAKPLQQRRKEWPVFILLCALRRPRAVYRTC